MYVKYANELTQAFDKLSHGAVKYGNNKLLMFVGESIHWLCGKPVFFLK